MIKVEIPKDARQIKQQIQALEYAMRTDNDKDRKIHQEALDSLKGALDEIHGDD